MSLPTYNRNNRRQSFQQLPKAAYVIKILSAKVARTASGFDQIVIAFDIAEGEYKDFYKSMYDRNTSEDKKWPNDAVFRLTIPYTNCPDYVVTNYDTFFADLEDSNNGFVFGGDEKTLKGKLIGAKMHIEQSEWNGNVYDHTRMRYTAIADDVRNGKAGKLPNDKLIQPKNTSGGDMNGYVNGGFSSSNDEEEIPFD